jgi:ribosomal protein S18 acetylase RimI-like enzyme
MQVLHDRDTIERLLSQNMPLHLYELGDLDEFFWPYTTWVVKGDQVALLYSGTPTPVLLALSDDLPAMRELFGDLKPFLPRAFHCHLSGDLDTLLLDSYRPLPHGLHYKMSLTDRTCPEKFDVSGVVQLSPVDLDEITAFYADSYPGNFFDARMLETGCYFGLRNADRLVSIAGIHVFSRQYRIAALGNVTTHPAFRGKGYATRVCAKLCQTLLPVCDHIGLNVKADNLSALGTYRKLGFEPVAEYSEFDFELTC